MTYLNKEVKVSKSLTFATNNIEVISFQGQEWMTSVDISRALGLGDDRVAKLYTENKEEFEALGDVSRTLFKGVQGRNLKVKIRVFNRRGAYLVAMLIRNSSIAKEFRRWVLDVLEEHHNPSSNKVIAKKPNIYSGIPLEQYKVTFGAVQRLIKEIDQRCNALATINSDNQAAIWLRDRLIEEIKDKTYILEKGMMEKQFPGTWKNLPIQETVRQFENEEQAFIDENQEKSTFNRSLKAYVDKTKHK